METEEDKALTAQIEAKDIFKKKCLVCHGESGQGDGPGSAALDPKPRNFTDAEWQKGVSDEQLSKTIIGGGAAVGKSAIMPGNPELKGKPEEVKALVAIIRGFKK
ncbi:MAG: cytochrome c [Polyangiaceae bacterium]